MYKLRGWVPLWIFTGLLIAFALALSKGDPGKLESNLIDKAFPKFELSQLDDANILMSESIFLGQVSLVNIFGSWCVACVQEHPTLMAIKNMDRVQLVGMNWRDGRLKARNWLKRYGDPYNYIIFDEYSELAVALGVTGAPETYLIDKKGHIRYKHVGIVNEKIWTDVFLPRIVQLEAEKYIPPLTEPSFLKTDPPTESLTDSLTDMSRALTRNLSDVEVEDRARIIGRSLRCVVCQNQSIEESDATLAEDMRGIVRARIREGATNQDVMDYMQSRYGDFILLKPPLQPNTYILWAMPFILLFLSGLWFWRVIYSRANTSL